MNDLCNLALKKHFDAQHQEVSFYVSSIYFFFWIEWDTLKQQNKKYKAQQRCPTKSWATLNRAHKGAKQSHKI